MATDGKQIFWNDEFTQKLSEDETRGVLSHEVLHIIFQHCEDHKGFDDKKLQNIAQDYVINPTLIDDGFVLPKGALYDKRFRNMTWRVVYRILEDCMEDPENPNGPAGNAGLSQEEREEIGQRTKDQMEDPTLEDLLEGSGLSEEEKEDLKRKVIQAAEAQRNSGIGSLPDGVDKLIEEIRASKIDWKEFLEETFRSNYPEDYTMRRPNKKFLQDNIYLPVMEGNKVGTLAVGLDTSGSVSDDEQIEYLAEINELTLRFKPEKVILLYCDWDVAKAEIYTDGEEIDTLKSRGGGGTSFVPVFNWLKENDEPIDQLIYMSDMEVHDSCFPEEHPDFPCLFISTREHYNVPFGTCITTRGY